MKHLWDSSSTFLRSLVLFLHLLWELIHLTSRVWRNIRTICINFSERRGYKIDFNDRISKSKVAYAKLVFRFNFDLRPDYRLEFVAAMRKKLAELPSDAQVRVGFDSDVFLEWLVDLRR